MTSVTYKKHQIDTQVMGKNVYSIELQPGLTSEDFRVFEEQFIEDCNPFYVSCKLEISRLKEIHLLQNAGYSLIEVQLQSRVSLRKQDSVSTEGYSFKLIQSQEDLQKILEIARTSITHDRFSVDQQIEEGFSGERYAIYVEQSFNSSNEEVWGIVKNDTNEIVAFRTHKFIDESKVLLLLGGVSPDLLGLGIGPISWSLCATELRTRGFVSAITHISASNYPVFNMEFGFFGFKLQKTEAVFRKVYFS
ncbi:hypothetical protein M2116_001708 [Aurantimicrobium minutum]|uniref:hypothetical protein n=1 Tax=Aurantimicrobium minutum TaxID=708131 RepID=UPI002406BD97|nr:hypothetical protein [Aurantimicrobium minutum]MDF9810729.1 hypothetical protein [Aurantimicrobium minutum]